MNVVIRFGLWSIILLVGAIQGLFVSVCLLLKSQNRQANAFLAGLIFLLSLKSVPYIIGYAGFYMAYPWLDLAPFDLGLGFGPLLYLYLVRLLDGKKTRNWWYHLVPLGIEFLTFLILFLQPLSFKNHFEDTIGPAFTRVDNLLNCLSFCAYLWLTWRMILRHEGRVAQQFSNPELHPLTPLKLNLAIITATLLAFTTAKVCTIFIVPLSYYQMFPFYVLMVLAFYLLGFVAFRFGNVEPIAISHSTESRETDWVALAEEYNQRLASKTFWMDPLLSLAVAARHLETSESRLSRAINVGLGMSFSAWINTYRIEQVARRLSDNAEESILDISTQCGFNSKASFNRWFRTVKGCTPTEFRSRQEPSSEPRVAPPEIVQP